VSKQTWDVLQVRESWLYDAKYGEGFGPQVSAIVCSGLLSCNGKGLAWESACNDINHSLICVGVPFTDECFDIAEDGRFVEEPIVDSLSDNALTVIIELDIPTMLPS
tara:strand:+ start:205 stop:525 length:321 start_codon:yes stop_codon:yes gene_type:complete